MPKIFINPGHAPGIDPGAVNGQTGLQEADAVHSIGRYVGELLSQVGYQTRVVQHDSLAYICEQSDLWEADLFVSIHCNSAENTSARGTETYHLDGSVAGKKLAGCIHKQLVETTGFPDRGIKTAGFYVLKYTDAPAVLAEVGFISNSAEAAKLGSPSHQYQYARAIARGVSDYFV